MRKHNALFIAAVAAISVTGAARATTITNWTGDAGDGLWTDAGNWDTVEPASGYQATFDGLGNGYTTVSFGGTTVDLASLEFTGSPAAYTIGTTFGDTLDFDNPGTISVGPTSSGYSGSANQTVDADIVDNGSISINNAIAGTTLTLNGNITGSGGIVVPSGTSSNGGAILFAGNNSFSGGVTLSSNSTTTVEIGSDTAFGTGTITPNNSSNSPLEAYGSDITLSNPVELTSGFTVDDAATAHNLTFAGPLTFGGNKTLTFNNYGTTAALGASPNSSTINLPSSTLTTSTATSNNVQLVVTNNGTNNAVLVLNDAIVDNPAGLGVGVKYGNSSNGAADPAGTVIINGANTYAGNTWFANMQSQLTVEIGSSSNGAYGTFTAGPFGTGIVTAGNTYTPSGGSAENLPPIFEPYGADQTVANAISITNGLFVENAPITGSAPVADPAGAYHNLTFTGPISFTSSGITNNLQAGVGLYLGTPTNPQPITDTGYALFQTQGGLAGNTYVYDAIGGSGRLVQQLGGTLSLYSNGNAYSGGTTVTGGTLLALNTDANSSATGTGAVTVSGSGTLGSGGILGGTGYIGGPLTIGSATAGSQGGVISPGVGGAGTLNVASLVFEPLGRYAFDYNGSSGTPGAGVNDLINGSGTLDLSALSSSAQFDLYLNSIAAGGGASSYILGTFAGGILDNGVEYPIGTDVTDLFSFSGSQSFTPDVQVVAGLSGGEALELYTASPTPEPAALALMGIGALGVLRRRRR